MVAVVIMAGVFTDVVQPAKARDYANEDGQGKGRNQRR